MDIDMDVDLKHGHAVFRELGLGYELGSELGSSNMRNSCGIIQL